MARPRLARRAPVRAAPLAFALSLAFAAPGAVAGASPPEPTGGFWRRAAGGEHEATRARDDTAGWFGLAVERTTAGRYAEAAAAYGEALASGGAEPSLYANLGEVLMADGRLPEAEAAYRDAIAAAIAAQRATSFNTRFDDLRERAQDLALGLLGLAVALDRDGQAHAAEETMRRALALDSTAGVLAVATLPNENLFFVPTGDIYYYVGLARAVAGHRSDAADAFRQFLEAVPTSRWARQAQAHLDALARAEPAGGARGPAPRVLAVGTVLSTGGAAAPLIDAAWRDQTAVLDDCLAAANLGAAGAPLRIAVEMEIDPRGRVTAAAVKLPAPADAALARCLERAVVARLRLPPAARATRARTEILVGFGAPPR